MTFFKSTLTAAALAVLSTGFASAAAVDTIEAPTNFFVPSIAQNFDTPFYRGFGEDWGWTHGAIASGFTSATLSISAFDVDQASGEVDEIYAYDNGVMTLLGSLEGLNDDFGFTTFTLTSNFYDDISAGLQVFMKIDTTNVGWFVTLAKSVVAVDGGDLPPPTPTVPVPAAGWLLMAGLGGLAALRRRKQA